MLNTLKVNRLLSRAQSIASQAGPKKAEAFYEGALKEHPGHSGLHLQFGLTLLNQGDYERALREIEKAYKLSPKNPVIPMFIGATMLSQDNYDQGLDYLNISLAQSPDNRLCASLKGLALLYLDCQNEGSNLLIDNFARGNPLLESMVFFYCESKCMALELDSLLLFEKALNPLGEQADSESEAPSKLSIAAISAAGLLDTGLNAFWKKVSKPFQKKTPEFTALFSSGISHFHHHRQEQAKDELEKCARMDYRPPPHIGAQLAEALYWLQSYRALSRILLKYFPEEYDDDPEIMLVRTKVAIHENDMEKAGALLKKIKPEPELQFWPAYLRGLISLRLGNHENAKSAFREAADQLGLTSTKTYYQAISVHDK